MMSMFYYPLSVMVSKWANCMAALDFSLKDYEDAMDEMPTRPPNIARFNPDLRIPRSWRLCVSSCRQDISQVKQFLQRQVTPTDQEYLNDPRQDYDAIDQNMGGYSYRV
ncbi:hypothetical protein BDV29DRAFT_184289 [Aspergillus leporis]|jgi:hypothetical protein|uniref:Uncharacterized protein n=1 Tax=Aspergillus leporis TaxID=41062 RepID=A0A5N5WLL8_9EURO|nr:hypothetical protein BDV29DRAFT_184289 [Aspergillus leporis]